MKLAYKFPLLLGAIGIASAVAYPAVAGNAGYVNGSSTIVLMNGASQSVAAEIGLPDGIYFSTSSITVTPAMVSDLSTNAGLISNLTLSTGNVASIAALNSSLPSSFTTAAAIKLMQATSLEGIVSIIRAGAGVDGLE